MHFFFVVGSGYTAVGTQPALDDELRIGKADGKARFPTRSESAFKNACKIRELDKTASKHESSQPLPRKFECMYATYSSKVKFLLIASAERAQPLCHCSCAQNCSRHSQVEKEAEGRQHRFTNEKEALHDR